MPSINSKDGISSAVADVPSTAASANDMLIGYLSTIKYASPV